MTPFPHNNTHKHVIQINHPKLAATIATIQETLVYSNHHTHQHKEHVSQLFGWLYFVKRALFSSGLGRSTGSDWHLCTMPSEVTKNMMSWDPSSAIIKPKKPADEARRCADCVPWAGQAPFWPLDVV